MHPNPSPGTHLELDHGIVRTAWDDNLNLWATQRTAAGVGADGRWDAGIHEPAKIIHAFFGMGVTELGCGMVFRCKTCHSAKSNTVRSAPFHCRFLGTDAGADGCKSAAESESESEEQPAVAPETEEHGTVLPATQ